MAEESNQSSKIRFNVTAVSSLDEHNEKEELLNGVDNGNHPNTAENTIGYQTHEAIPMTVFYRNENSHSEGKPKAKARPTLYELRKGFDSKNPPENEVCIALYLVLLYHIA